MSDKTPATRPGLIDIDLKEYGGKKEGVPQSSDARLFMQLLVLECHEGTLSAAESLTELLRAHGIAGVVYRDANDPKGLGLLTWSKDPAHFVDKVAPLFDHELLETTLPRRELSLLGRTYSLGYEPDLEHVLFHRPVGNVENPEYGWHVWYPLRRNGAFAKLSHEEQSQILKEHSVLGMSYGATNAAHDVRLACYGMDVNDNDFVVGLISSELHPLSHLVQTMRKTKQTSEFIEKLGPFFVGRVHARVKP